MNTHCGQIAVFLNAMAGDFKGLGESWTVAVTREAQCYEVIEGEPLCELAA
jgi:hypothetical protein